MIGFVLVGAIIIIFGFVVFFGAPYVPSQKKYIRRAFEQLYKLNASDVLIDVGSGDGIVLRLAAEKGATAIGYEINPLLVMISKLASSHDKKISIQLANFWHVQLPKNTTIVYAFAVSRDGKKLVRKMSDEATRLKKPLKVMCYGSPLPHITADKTFDAYHLYTFYPLQPQKAQV